ncbi:MAG: hypothetical protein JSV86_02325 [Gemmatimonadota bacterium]|nr:MAG: hypothetical protein JSV86_02325 [Gemmatimonadota bacterium]
MTRLGDFAKLLALGATFGALGCGGAAKVAELEESPVGTEVIVERSAGERPDWITEPPEDDDGMKFFSGGEEGYVDYAMGLRMAKAEAWQELGESVLGIWSSLLQASEVGGKERLQQYARNFQELAVKEISLSGTEVEERYYEKVAVKTTYGVEYHYNAFVLVKVPEDEYHTAQLRALEQLRNRAKRENNTDAEEFIDEAIQRLNEIEG